MLEVNKVYCIDCLEGLNHIPDNSIDLIVTDPPYNMGKEFANDKLEKVDYLNWIKICIDEFIRVTKTNGSIYIILGHNIIADIKVYLDSKKELDYKNWITWAFKNGFGGTRNYSYRHEDILYYIKVPNKSIIKDFSDYIKTQRQELGYSLKKVGQLCGEKWYHRGGSFYFETGLTQPNIKQYFKLKEVLNLNNNFDQYFNSNFIFNFDDIAITPIRLDKNIRKSGKNPSNVWMMDSLVWNNKEKEKHQSQKPLELIKRIISASTNKDNLVLDPFLGTGTTAVACKQLKRRFIGFEISKEYVEISNKRISQSTL